MASPEEVKTQTGYTIGGVSPVGHLDIITIRDATEEEISHGHAHGPGGHEHQ